jgi:hypothetical protein
MRVFVRGRVMPIRQYLSDNRSFEPDDVRAINDALTAALAKLGLKDRSDAMVEMVARRIILAALAGERSIIRLTDIGAGGTE